MTAHPFDTATHLEPLPDGGLRGHTSPAYANMVGPFGGITAACMLQAPLQHAARIGDPIALTINFAAALADGEFVVTAKAARTNRSTQHWTIELVQNGAVAATATAVFATRRPTWSALDAAAPAVAAANTFKRTEPVARLAWTHRYDMRFARGGLPTTLDEQLQADAVSHVWVRDEPPRPLDFVSLASISDSFFPRVYLRRRKLVPIGTVSLTTYFHADSALLAAQGARPVLGNARGLNYRNGFFDQSAEVWSDDGDLLASSHQLVYFRE